MKNKKWFPWIFVSALLLMGFKDNNVFRSSAGDVKGTLLVYVGSFSNGYYNITIDIHVEITSSVGVRYEGTLMRGDQIMTDMATVWRFDDQKKYMTVNNRTKRVSYESYKSDAGGDGDNKISVVGKGKVDKYQCTQLSQPAGDGGWIYWMSKEVPGYQQLSNKLFQLNPAYPGMIFGIHPTKYIYPRFLIISI